MPGQWDGRILKCPNCDTDNTTLFVAALSHKLETAVTQLTLRCKGCGYAVGIRIDAEAVRRLEELRLINGG